MSAVPTDKLSPESQPEASQTPSPIAQLAPPVPTAAPKASASPASLMAPSLGSGSSLPSLPAPGSSPARDPRKTTASGEALTSLAEPQVFRGPEVELQQKIVDRLEAIIPDLDAKSKAKREDCAKKLAILRADRDAHLIDMKTYQERSAALARDTPNPFDVPILYIGSVVLSEIPPTTDGDPAMIAGAELVPTDNALGATEDGSELPHAAGVAHHVVRNTLRTMIEAGQMDYLRKSGIVGRDWQVIVEIHYYRSRTKTQANLHKDTLGQTMFVNLNYTNETAMPGPEFIVNPPLEPTHEASIAHTLPQTFLDDLAETRTLPAPTTIKTETLPAHAVVAFVDEAIHHATPLVGYRPASVGAVKKFLKTDAEFAATYDAAVKAFADSKAQGRIKSAMSWWSFSAYFKEAVSAPARDMWGALMALCDKNDLAEVFRPDLLKAGMSHTQIDRLHSSVHLGNFSSVNIPARARTEGGGRLDLTTGGGGEKRPLGLTRQMSAAALTDSLPPLLPVETPRRFFRTWVRAVPAKKASAPLAVTSGGATATTGTSSPAPVMKAASGLDSKSPRDDGT